MTIATYGLAFGILALAGGFTAAVFCGLKALRETGRRLSSSEDARRVLSAEKADLERRVAEYKHSIEEHVKVMEGLQKEVGAERRGRQLAEKQRDAAVELAGQNIPAGEVATRLEEVLKRIGNIGKVES